MAPFHTSKKTSITTLEAASRRGTHQVHKQRVKQYEEEVLAAPEDANDAEVDDADADDADYAMTEASQGLTISVQQKLNEMQTARKTRIEAHKQEVHRAYDAAYAETKEAITSHFDEHEARASEAHDAQMARLKDLVQKKAQIETMMVEKLGELRKDYFYHSKALEMVVEHRMKQLN